MREESFKRGNGALQCDLLSTTLSMQITDRTYLKNLLKKPCFLLAHVSHIWRETAYGVQPKGRYLGEPVGLSQRQGSPWIVGLTFR